MRGGSSSPRTFRHRICAALSSALALVKFKLGGPYGDHSSPFEPHALDNFRNPDFDRAALPELSGGDLPHPGRTAGARHPSIARPIARRGRLSHVPGSSCPVRQNNARGAASSGTSTISLCPVV